jgi:hypothetical protein
VHSRVVDAAVTSVGVVAVVVTGDLFSSASFGSFENPHLTLFHRLIPLWRVLEFAPGIIIGLLIRRNPKRISAVPYALGVMINYYRFDGYGIAHEVPMPWSLYLRIMIASSAFGAFLGAVLALTGQLIRRLTIGWSDRGWRLR